MFYWFLKLLVIFLVNICLHTYQKIIFLHVFVFNCMYPAELFLIFPTNMPVFAYFEQLGPSTIEEPPWWTLGRWCPGLPCSCFKHYGNSNKMFYLFVSSYLFLRCMQFRNSTFLISLGQCDSWRNSCKS